MSAHTNTTMLQTHFRIVGKIFTLVMVRLCEAMQCGITIQLTLSKYTSSAISFCQPQSIFPRIRISLHVAGATADSTVSSNNTISVLNGCVHWLKLLYQRMDGAHTVVSLATNRHTHILTLAVDNVPSFTPFNSGMCANIAQTIWPKCGRSCLVGIRF